MADTIANKDIVLYGLGTQAAMNQVADSYTTGVYKYAANSATIKVGDEEPKMVHIWSYDAKIEMQFYSEKSGQTYQMRSVRDNVLVVTKPEFGYRQVFLKTQYTDWEAEKYGHKNTITEFAPIE